MKNQTTKKFKVNSVAFVILTYGDAHRFYVFALDKSFLPVIFLRVDYYSYSAMQRFCCTSSNRKVSYDQMVIFSFPSNGDSIANANDIANVLLLVISNMPFTIEFTLLDSWQTERRNTESLRSKPMSVTPRCCLTNKYIRGDAYVTRCCNITHRNRA